MPVRIWIKSKVIDALPKTYHQPSGPESWRGTGCISIGPKLSRRLSRKSSHVSNRLIARSSSFHASGEGILQRGQMGRLDLQFPVFDPPDALEQTARWGSRRAFAILVVDPAVAGTHEQARLRKPRHGAAQVRAIHRENQELVLLRLVFAQVADVDTHLGRHSVPGLGHRIGERGKPGLIVREFA